MPPKKPLTIIGRAEYIRLVDLCDQEIPAKVDTGADLSSVWASDISEKGDGLHFVLFGQNSLFYTGGEVFIPKGSYRLARISNSFGDKESRYVVKLTVRVRGRIVKSTFSLADRSMKTYPVLLGRRFLKGKFLVDVSLGNPLLSEKAKTAARQKEQRTFR